MESLKSPIFVGKWVVTCVAIAALLVHLFSPSVRLDTTGLVLVFLALLPWLASVISRAELPGGWKLEFQAVKTEQQRQAKEIDALKFLVSNFLTEREGLHLQGLSSNQAYRVRRDGTTTYFEMEIRRLRALGFIQGRPDRGVRTLLRAIQDAGGKEVDVQEHFEITARGHDYLRLRTEMLTPVLTPRHPGDDKG